MIPPRSLDCTSLPQMFVCWLHAVSGGWLKRVLTTGNRKEGSVLFNDTLNTFDLQLHGVGYMVSDHSDIERKPAAATWATLF